MTKRSILIRLAETHNSGSSLHLSASLVEPHKGPRGIREIPLSTLTRTLNREFADSLTPALMKELADALALVAKNWYETQELPFK
jgi:hypothetical protein